MPLLGLSCNSSGVGKPAPSSAVIGQPGPLRSSVGQRSSSSAVVGQPGPLRSSVGQRSSSSAVVGQPGPSRAGVGQRSSSAVVGQPGPSRSGSPPRAEAAKDYARTCQLPPLEGSSIQCSEFNQNSDIFQVNVVLFVEIFNRQLFWQEKVDRLRSIFTGHEICVIENVLKDNSEDEQSACEALLDSGWQRKYVFSWHYGNNCNV